MPNLGYPNQFTIFKTQSFLMPKLSLFDVAVEVLGWLRIVASPLIIGSIAGFVVYLAVKGIAGILLGSLIALAGLIAGIVWANKVWKKKGTMHFMSRNIAMPELEQNHQHKR